MLISHDAILVLFPLKITERSFESSGKHFRRCANNYWSVRLLSIFEHIREDFDFHSWTDLGRCKFHNYCKFYCILKFCEIKAQKMAAWYRNINLKHKISWQLSLKFQIHIVLHKNIKFIPKQESWWP